MDFLIRLSQVTKGLQGFKILWKWSGPYCIHQIISLIVSETFIYLFCRHLTNVLSRSLGYSAAEHPSRAMGDPPPGSSEGC